MWSRPLGANIQDNPLVESPYCQQDELGVASPPPAVGMFLLSTGDDFLLSTGSDFLLSG